MNVSATIQLMPNRDGNLKAFATLIIDEVIAISNFKVLTSKSGELFVGLPSRPGKDKEGNPTYYDDIRFLDEKEENERDTPLSRDIKGMILKQYEKAVKANSASAQDNNNARAARAQAQVNVASSKKPTAPPSRRTDLPF